MGSNKVTISSYNCFQPIIAYYIFPCLKSGQGYFVSSSRVFVKELKMDYNLGYTVFLIQVLGIFSSCFYSSTITCIITDPKHIKLKDNDKKCNTAIGFEDLLCSKNISGCNLVFLILLTKRIIQ